MKKLFATVLALVMMLSVMSVTAFAAPTAKSADLDGHTYKAFQIFSGTQKAGDNTGKLADVEWGSGVDGDALLAALQADSTFVKDGVNVFVACTTPAKVAEAMKGWSDSSPEAKAFAKLAYANKAGSGIDCVSGTTPLNAGYYLVVDVTEPVADAKDFVSNLALLQLTNRGTFDIQNKVDVPEVDKVILDPTEMKANEASIGDEVKYQITGTLPTDIADYNAYKYVFHDTLSAGLTYNDNMKVYVNGEDETSAFTVSASGTSITVSINDLLLIGGITKDTKVVLKYSATLNEKAVIAGAGNPNEVYLEYSNNPNESGTPGNPGTPTGKTPEDKVVTYTTELTITKHDDQDQILTGAEFQLTGDGVNVVITTGKNYVKDAAGTFYKLNDGTYTETAPTTETASKYESEDTYKEVTTVSYDTSDASVDAKAFVKDDGTLTFTGLGAGNYTLTETTTPDGYNTIAPITFKVSFDNSTKQFSTNNSDITVGATNTLATTVINNSGSTLPETGGIGTRIFYAVGGIMLVGAAVMLVAKKRMDAED